MLYFFNSLFMVLTESHEKKIFSLPTYLMLKLKIDFQHYIILIIFWNLEYAFPVFVNKCGLIWCHFLSFKKIILWTWWDVVSFISFPHKFVLLDIHCYIKSCLELQNVININTYSFTYFLLKKIDLHFSRYCIFNLYYIVCYYLFHFLLDGEFLL